MKKRKNLEAELKKYNIPYWKYGDKYSLWHKPYDNAGNFMEDCLKTERQCWKTVSHYKGKVKNNARKLAKKLQNRKIRKSDPTEAPIVKANKRLWTYP